MSESGAPGSASGDAPRGDRRYSSDEFGLIMRKAFELEERAPRTIAGRDGLTLAEMKSIAAEVGLDPAAIASAVALVPAERAGLAARVLGAPEAFAYELWLDGELDQGAGDVFLQTIRHVLRQRGEVRRAGDRVEWKSVGRSDHVRVTLSRGAGRTVVDIAGDRRPALLFALLAPLLVWGALAAVVGLTASFAGAAVMLPVAALAASYVTARTAWRGASRRLRGRLERLALALRTDAVRMAVGPGGGAQS